MSMVEKLVELIEEIIEELNDNEYIPVGERIAIVDNIESKLRDITK